MPFLGQKDLDEVGGDRELLQCQIRSAGEGSNVLERLGLRFAPGMK
jgi:hypothetical protein